MKLHLSHGGTSVYLADDAGNRRLFSSQFNAGVLSVHYDAAYFDEQFLNELRHVYATCQDPYLSDVGISIGTAIDRLGVASSRSSQLDSNLDLCIAAEIAYLFCLQDRIANEQIPPAATKAIANSPPRCVRPPLAYVSVIGSVVVFVPSENVYEQLPVNAPGPTEKVADGPSGFIELTEIPNGPHVVVEAVKGPKKFGSATVTFTGAERWTTESDVGATVRHTIGMPTDGGSGAPEPIVAVTFTVVPQTLDEPS